MPAAPNVRTAACHSVTGKPPFGPQLRRDEIDHRLNPKQTMAARIPTDILKEEQKQKRPRPRLSQPHGPAMETDDLDIALILWTGASFHEKEES